MRRVFWLLLVLPILVLGGFIYDYSASITEYVMIAINGTNMFTVSPDASRAAAPFAYGILATIAAAVTAMIVLLLATGIVADESAPSSGGVYVQPSG